MDLRIVAVANYSECPQWDVPEVTSGARELREAFEQACEVRVRDESYRAIKGDYRTWLAELSQHKNGPLVVYWAGHAERLDEYRAALIDSSEEIAHWEALTVDDLYNVIRDRQSREDAGGENWLMIILDTCQSSRAVWDLWRRFEDEKPASTAVIATSGQATAQAGVFPAIVAAELAGIGVNETSITVEEVLRRIVAALRMKTGAVQDQHLYNNIPAIQKWPRKGSTPPLTGNRADIMELRTILGSAEADARSHFYARAWGAGINYPEWNFTGRVGARRDIIDWLEGRDSRKLYAVTGPAGSGKSALLGMILLSSSRAAAEDLKDLGVEFPRGTIPQKSIEFTTTVHLSRRTLSEVVDEIARQEELSPDISTVDELIEGLHVHRSTSLILADALDECSEPFAVASMFRRLADLANCRVLIGTRRSLSETADSGLPPNERLLHHLRPDDMFPVEKSGEDYKAYIRRRLKVSLPGANVRTLESVADDIAKQARTFLYVRLAVDEVIAEPGWLRKDAAWSKLLRSDHRQLFDLAVRRMRVADPVVEHLLHALAYARGSGLPRTGGIWQACGAAIAGAPLTDPDVSRALSVAAPYIVEDLEFGREVYRLGHYTFVEQYLASDLGSGLS